LPDVLLKNQALLGLSAVDLVVLINLLSYWWFVEHKPFPRATLIARRMNVTTRTVQRSIQKLVEKGFLARRTQVGPEDVERDVLDPEGLVSKLEKLARHDPIYAVREQRRGLDEVSETPS
jgi:DNA replication protein DnaD